MAMDPRFNLRFSLHTCTTLYSSWRLQSVTLYAYFYFQDYDSEKDICSNYKRVLDAALSELVEHRERELQRQKTIEAMYDGEARMINEKQDKVCYLNLLVKFQNSQTKVSYFGMGLTK